MKTALKATFIFLSLGMARAEPLDTALEWAPVLYQDLANGISNDDSKRRRDLLAPVNFDGNWNPYDNVENTDSGAHSLPGSVYFDLVETETHLYLLYSLFHPVDWNTFGSVDHENDMEQVWTVIEKHADGSKSISAVAAQTHGEFLVSAERRYGL